MRFTQLLLPLFGLYFWCYLPIFAQNEAQIDSLQKILQAKPSTLQQINAITKLVEIYSYFDSTQTAHYFEELLAITEQTPSDSSLAFAYFNYGWLVMDRGNFNQAEALFQVGRDYGHQAQHLSYEGFGYQGLGNIARFRGNYQQALNFYQKFLELV